MEFYSTFKNTLYSLPEISMRKFNLKLDFTAQRVKHPKVKLRMNTRYRLQWKHPDEAGQATVAGLNPNCSGLRNLQSLTVPTT